MRRVNDQAATGRSSFVSCASRFWSFACFYPFVKTKVKFVDNKQERERPGPAATFGQKEQFRVALHSEVAHFNQMRQNKAGRRGRSDCCRRCSRPDDPSKLGNLTILSRMCARLHVRGPFRPLPHIWVTRPMRFPKT